MRIDNPSLGNATATTLNKVTVTAPTTGATLTLADGATLTASATASVSGTNTGDNAVNTLYSSLVTNATHTGDVTGSGTLTIASGAVTYAKIQNVSATSRVLGRITAAAGVVEELTGANLATIIGITNTAANVTSVNGATGAVTLTNLGLQNFTSGATVSGSNTGDNAVNTLYSGLVTNATHTGDVTGSGALTLASIIVAGGPTGSTSVVPVITWDAKGRLTAVTTATITPASIGAQASGTYVTSVGVTAPVASTGGTAPTISMAAATASVNGYMTSTYASKLDGIAAGATANTGTVTGVTGTAPVVSSGGTAPAISMAAATATVNGYMTSTYASKLDGIAASATNVTNTNQLTNGAGYITSAGTSAACSGNAATATAASSVNSTNAQMNGTDGWWRSTGNAGWYSTTYAVGIYATEAGNVRTYNGANFIAAGTVTGSNLSGTHTGSSSGTNTGDQTNISGNAATVTVTTGRVDPTSYPIVWQSGNSLYSCAATTIQSSTGTINATNFTATGSVSAATKSFLIPHPTKIGMKLRYGSLEGPENGVYVRGRLSGDTIELPEYWTKLVDANSITVSLTSIGKHQDLFVKEITDNKITIGNQNLFSNKIDCFYVVYGERVDVDKLVVEF